MEERKAEKREPNPQVKKPAEKPYPEKRERKRPQAAKRPPKKAVAKLLRKKEGKPPRFRARKVEPKSPQAKAPPRAEISPWGAPRAEYLRKKSNKTAVFSPGHSFLFPFSAQRKTTREGALRFTLPPTLDGRSPCSSSP